MANTFKKAIDRMEWVQVSPAPNVHAAGVSLCSDLRNGITRNPFVYQFANPTVLNKFNIITKAWMAVAGMSLSATFGAGAVTAFIPSFGAIGTVAAGATTTRVPLSTFLTSVGVNVLANRGGSGDHGFKLRIIDPVAGKTEERFIVGNTAGATPTIRVDSPFSFVPSSGARCELLSGRVFALGTGTIMANISLTTVEVATNWRPGTFSIANLPATIATDTAAVVLDEQYTPYDCLPGEGMVKGAFEYDVSGVTLHALAATAVAASTLTGQATLGDAVIAANEYRNFQIRIVQDTTNPTAVGQRRIIASHTAGPSPVYTLGTAWTVQPSANAKFVIEMPNLMLLRSSATTSVYTYNYTDAAINNGTNSIASGAWSTTYFGAAPAANAAGGVWAPSWGIEPDPDRNARHSFNFFFRGNATAVDLLDIAGAPTGAWTANVAYDGAVSLPAGTSAAYSPFNSEGRMTYINAYVSGAVNQMYRFDAMNRTLSPYTATDFVQSGTAAVGNRMAAYCAIDTDQNYDVVLLQSHLSTITQELIPLV